MCRERVGGVIAIISSRGDKIAHHDVAAKTPNAETNNNGSSVYNFSRVRRVFATLCGRASRGSHDTVPSIHQQSRIEGR